MSRNSNLAQGSCSRLGSGVRIPSPAPVQSMA